MKNGGITPERFAALIEEFRQNITRERFVARLSEVKQEELVELVKLQAELRARYLMAVLDMVQPNVADIAARVDEARQYREMADEVNRGVQSVTAAVLAKEIPVPGLDHGEAKADEIERALEMFIRQANDEWDVTGW
jgi:nitrogenase subunit NifH